MSNKFFKKLCLIFAIIFTFSLMPGTMLCNAEKSVTEDLGEVSFFSNGRAPGLPTYVFCRDVENAEKLNFTTQLTGFNHNPPAFYLSMFECIDGECMSATENRTKCLHSQKFNTTNPSSLVVDRENLKVCSIDHFWITVDGYLSEIDTVKFKSELTATSSTKDPVIKKPDKCVGAASSLVAPFAAVATAILGLLAL